MKKRSLLDPRSLRLLVMGFSLAGFASLPASTLAQEWPSLRGPNFDGSANVQDSELAAGPLKLNVVWKKSAGSGYSGVVTAGDRIVCAMADAAAGKEFVVALSKATGETLWRTPTGKIMQGENGSFDGPIATPAVDAERAYHLSPFGDLAAYSLADGTEIWKHNLKDEFAAEPNFYGLGACPIVHEGVVIVPVGSPEGAVMGFAPATGKVLWKAGQDGAAFHAAIPVSIENQSRVAVAGNTTLHIVDPTTGEVIWDQSHRGAKGMPVFSIVPVPLAGGGLFLNDDRNGSAVLNIGASGSAERWQGRDIRNTYCVPVISGNLLCSYSSRILVAVDPATGKRKWRSREPGNGFLATFAGRLLVSTLDGSLHIGDVSEDGFSEVVATQVFDSTAGGKDGVVWSLPAIAGNSVYLRSLGAIARVDILPGEGQLLAAAQSELAPGFSKFIENLEVSNDKEAAIKKYLDGKTTPIIEGDYVHFVLQGDYQDVAVASDLFGIRQERSMQKVEGTELFYFGVHLPQSTRASYVFYADYTPVVDPTNTRQFTSTTLTGEMEPNFMGPGPVLELSWFSNGKVDGVTVATDDLSWKLAGRLEKLTVKSKAMKKEVEASVYLPPGYDNTDVSYPVVFVHDGKVAMDAGNQPAILDELIQSKQVRPSIAVFIDHRFYAMLGMDGYPEMFAGELIPQVESMFRVSQDRDDRASLGAGMGGMLAMLGTLPSSQKTARIGCHSLFAFEMLHAPIQQLSKLDNDRCQVVLQWSQDFEYRNPSENWNMAWQSEAVAKILEDANHDVITEETAVGTDWASWRTQSKRMWQFLIGD